MNRPFWLFRTSAPLDNCETIEPLLSAYADSMASPAEVQRIEAHLPECKGCRTALSWMQATRAALASRPIALPPVDLHSRIILAIALSSRPVAAPPADLHSRIALAIAKSSPAPVLRRPARVFTVRTAYAAAVSVSALGIALSYPLWHTSGEVAVHPPETVAAVTAPPDGKPQATPRTLVRPLIASNTASNPDAAKPPKHTALARKKTLTAVTPPEHIARNTPPVKLPLVPQEVITPAPHALLAPKIASRNIAPTEKHSSEKHLPLPVKTSLPEGPKVAKIIEEPPHIHLDIQPTKITPDAPPVQTASASHFTPPSLDYGMGEVRAKLRLQNAIYAPAHNIRQEISHEAANVIQTVGTVGNDDQTAVVAGVYSPR